MRLRTATLLRRMPFGVVLSVGVLMDGVERLVEISFSGDKAVNIGVDDWDVPAYLIEREEARIAANSGAKLVEIPVLE